MAQYTTAKLLTDGDLNPIPQYLDTSDTTDSPEGTFKPLDQVMETSLTGSNVPDNEALPNKNISKTEMTTVINAMSVSAGANTGLVDMGLDGTESLALVLINIDQQPWSCKIVNQTNDVKTKALYPEANGVTTTFATTSKPYSGVYVPFVTGGGLTSVTNLNEALLLASAVDLNAVASVGKVQIDNDSTSTATITVRIIRMWRGK
jgi:hypothetical protein